MNESDYISELNRLKENYNKNVELLDKEYIAVNSLYFPGDIIEYKLSSGIHETGVIVGNMMYPPNIIHVVEPVESSIFKDWKNIKVPESNVIRRIDRRN